MGQKVNPVGLRVGLIKGWRSRWFAEKSYAQFLKEDLRIREFIQKRLARAGISKIDIERAGDRLKIDIFTARPGMVIGRRGSEVDALRENIEKQTKKQAQINIQEINRPELDATLVAQSVAEQLEARVAFRRAMKRAVSSAMRAGALGIRITSSGRLGGSEMARTEWYREGRVPLHTLRADIDYGLAEALTTVGRIGVKVWIYNGDLWPAPEDIRHTVVPEAEAETAPGEPTGAEKEAAPAKVETVAKEAAAEKSEEKPEKKRAPKTAAKAKAVVEEAKGRTEKSQDSTEKAGAAKSKTKAVAKKTKSVSKTASSVKNEDTDKKSSEKASGSKPRTKKAKADLKESDEAKAVEQD